MKPLPAPRGTCITSIENRSRLTSTVVIWTVEAKAARNTAMLRCSSSASGPRGDTARGSAPTRAFTGACASNPAGQNRTLSASAAAILRYPCMMKSYRIASIPGDGIGKEVIAAGIEVMDALAAKEGFRLEFEHFDWSSARYLKTGAYIPDGGLERLKAFDAILFGAVGSPDVPDHISLWGLRLPICQGFDQYANVRPSRVLPGVESRLKGGNNIDWVIMPREFRGRILRLGRTSAQGSAGGNCH